MNKNVKKEIKNLVNLSKYAGERFDLVQSAGGNTSIKINNRLMIIKSSGVSLSELEVKKGFSMVNNKKIIQILKSKKILKNNNKNKREALAQKFLKKANLEKNNKPSIEVFLHACLKKVTLHTHPIAALNILSLVDSEQVINKIFKNYKFLFIKYKTPGIELALELRNNLQTYHQMKKELPKIIFLQNHGMIINDISVKKVKKLNDEIIIKMEKFLKVSYYDYRLTNLISNLAKKVTGNQNLISYLSEDRIINNKNFIKKYLFLKPTCPDVFVFNGFIPCKIKNLKDSMSIKRYKKKFHIYPKILVFKSKVFFLNTSIKKTKSMEEMLKFHFLLLENAKGKKNYLSINELNYLLNMSSEKYRQNI